MPSLSGALLIGCSLLIRTPPHQDRLSGFCKALLEGPSLSETLLVLYTLLVSTILIGPTSCGKYYKYVSPSLVKYRNSPGKYQNSPGKYQCDRNFLKIDV